MNILGFNCYGHDSAAALLLDNKIVFAVEEERLNRKKHFGGVPELAIKECLKNAGLKLSDIDHVTFFWKPSISYSKIPVYLLKFWDKVPQLLKEQREFSVEENLGMLNYLKDMKKLPKTLAALFPNEKMKFNAIGLYAYSGNYGYGYTKETKVIKKPSRKYLEYYLHQNDFELSSI